MRSRRVGFAAHRALCDAVERRRGQIVQFYGDGAPVLVDSVKDAIGGMRACSTFPLDA